MFPIIFFIIESINDMHPIIATKDYENKCLIIEMTDKSNSFTVPFLSALIQALELATDDKQIHSVILTSKTNVFSVGGDLHDMKQEIETGNRSGYVDKIVPKINLIISKIIGHQLPVICVLNGVAAGGGLSLALSCDYIFAKENTKLVPAFGTLALTPDSGSSIVLSEKLGYSLALKLIGTSDNITSNDAVKIGAIQAIGRTEDMMTEALRLAKKFGSADRWALSGTKKLLNQNLSYRLKERLEAEYQSIHEASSREEFISRLNSIIENLQ